MINRLICMASCLAFVGCVLPVDDQGDPDETDAAVDGLTTSSKIKRVFVIVMENQGSSNIYGNTAHAPYINQTLLPAYGHATHFIDTLPTLDSEPHYIWMEAGTNAFADQTFTTDNDPSATNSTASKLHLTTQLKTAGATWRAYQESIDTGTGGCPIASNFNYNAKHDPFVFFRDVAGNPPAKTAPYCVAHHRPLTALAADLASNHVAAYNFITPNLCHDMHFNLCWPGFLDPIRQGDDWLAANVPAIITYVNAHAGVLFIVWDEPAGSTGTIPFIVVGPHVLPNHASAVQYSHGSLVKSVEDIFALPTLATVTNANGFGDFFASGFYP